MLRLIPAEARLSFRPVVFLFEVRLRAVERAPGGAILSVPGVAGAISRRVIIVGIITIVIRFAGVSVAPVGIFGSWIDRFSDTLAGESTRHGSNNSADSGADGAACGHADRCASGAAARCANASADRM